MSSQKSSSSEVQVEVRKRVCKACDRCRLKKSKCDGTTPCSRCKTDNAICVFGKKKKPKDKVYPKGYVEILEQQQAQLVAGLRELYNRLQTGHGWPHQLQREARSGHPLTHDILEQLNLLRGLCENGNTYEGFEEDCSRLQNKLIDEGALLSYRHRSVSSDSGQGHISSSSSYSGTPVVRQFSVVDPLAGKNAISTSPEDSPSSRKSQMIVQMREESPAVSSTLMHTGAFDDSALSGATWTDESAMTKEAVDLSKPMYGFESFSNYNQILMVDPTSMNPSDLMMPDWNNISELDASIRLEREFCKRLNSAGCSCFQDSFV